MQRTLIARSLVGLAIATGLAVLGALALSERLPPADREAKVGRLVLAAVLQGSDSFVPSGVASQPNCDILLVGSEWGSIARLFANGTFDTTTGSIPGYRRVARLEDGGAVGAALVWSHNPPFLGVIRPNLWVDSIPLPMHPWGHQWSGPASQVRSGLVALAPLGDRDVERRPSNGWTDAPVAFLLDLKGRVVSSVGAVRKRPGRYLSWLETRLTLGSAGDTILWVTLSQGTVSGRRTDVGQSPPVFTATLPRYVPSPRPAEVVRRLASIQQGGELAAFSEVPQVSLATVGPNGRIYAVRAYATEKEPGPNWYPKRFERWATTREGLEVYNATGTLLGAFAMPHANVAWLRVDHHGRVFVRAGPRNVLVMDDPFYQGTRCPPLPPRVPIDVGDRPSPDPRTER